jgi:hypothetical protein
VECVRTRSRPLSDGDSGLRAVRVLEALQSSLAAGGERRQVAAATVAG